MFDNPIVSGVAICFVVGLVGGGITRLPKLAALTGLAVAAVFLVSHYLAYGAIPGFPPVGATSKVFYAVPVLAVIGLALDIVPPLRRLGKPVAIIVPLLLAVWIAWIKLQSADSTTYLAIAVLWIAGAAAALRAGTLENADPVKGGGAIPVLAIILSLSVGFAPIALAGGSSTGLGLQAAYAAGLGGIGLIEVLLPRRRFGWSAVLAGLAAILGPMDALVIVSQQGDTLPLVLLLLVLVFGQIVFRLLPFAAGLNERLRWILAGVLTFLPALLVIGVTFVRHADAFQP